PARTGAPSGCGDRQAEKVRVRLAPEGGHEQRIAVAVRIRSGPRGIPSGDRGILPFAGEETTAVNWRPPRRQPHRQWHAHHATDPVCCRLLLLLLRRPG